MSKLNRSFLKKINSVFATLLVLLGFSVGLNSCMYGVEIEEFVVKGNITNAETGEAIEGIRVTGHSARAGVMYGPPMPDFSTKPVYTDERGNYFKFLNDTIPDFFLHIQDVDGEKNGAFRDTTVVVRFDERSRTAIVDVALTPKTENE